MATDNFYQESNLKLSTPYAPGTHYYSEANFSPAGSAASGPTSLLNQLPKLAPSPYTQESVSSRGGGGDGSSFDSLGKNKSYSLSLTNYSPDQNSITNGFVHAMLNPVPSFAPVVDTTGFTSVAQAESAQNQALAAQYGMYGNPNVGLGGEVGSSTAPAAGATNASHGGESGGWGGRDAGGALPAGGAYAGAPVGGSDVGRSAPGSAHVDSGPAPSNNPAPTNNSENGGWGSRDAGGSGEAKGGYITKKPTSEDRPTLEDMLHYIMMRAK